MAKKSGAEGISYTYTEPTIFYELAYETAKMAHREGLYNTFVTNGYISPEPVEKIGPYLDAVTVDFKGSGDEEFLEAFAGIKSAEPIYGALKEYKNQGVHVEVTDLIVPRVGDSEAKIEELVGWILNNLGKETPVHFLRFYPAHKVQDIPPTDVDKLKTAREIAESAGMDYVYLGNVRANNATRCPDCGNVVISRSAGMVTGVDIEDSDCPSCGASVNVSGLSWVMKNR
jgi:pyruvate formate lyase activating enzyme